MGEEVKQADAKPEEKVDEKKEEEKPTEDKNEEPQKPPSPFVLFVDLHCVGCAKKLEKSIMKFRGVEGVMIDMAQNQVTIKGIVEPQAICNIIMKKTKRRAKVLSPLPEAEGKPLPQVVTSQVSGSTTVELNINMHCEACGEQLKRKILKMRGVRTVVTELSTGKVTVTGAMDSEKLVDYVYRRTKKQARIVPQPQLEKKEEEKEEHKPGEDAKPVEKEKEKEKEEEKEEKKEEEKTQTTQEPKKEEEKTQTTEDPEKEDENNKPAENKEELKKEGDGEILTNINEENMKRMMYFHQPLYVIERIPPPQLFSDENPNACSIS